MTRTHLLAAAAAAALAAAGCGGGGPKPVPVTGKVVYDDGQPATELAGGTVIFEAKQSSTGEIGPDGRFTLTFLDKDDGALPGEYKVAIIPADPGGEDNRPRARPIPAVYSNVEETPLKATVEAKKNDLTLTVPRAKGGR